ncbi:MAG: hypothetical protein KDD55_12730, partial [Bdellovibrionales bacterium]|nr:hypothetical protein [Bdellovibrionales bacterium]
MTKLLFPLLTFCFLSFPLLTELIAPQWEQTLGGVTKERKRPSLSLESFTSGKFQTRFEKWLLNSLGIRAPLVKTDNQLNYSLFSQLFSSTKGKAILGNDGHLIEKSYLLRAQGALYPKKKALEQKIQEVTALHHLLEAKGKFLIVLISANKPALHPEVTPEIYTIGD